MAPQMLANGKHGGLRSMVTLAEQVTGSARDPFYVVIFHVRCYPPVFGWSGPVGGKLAGRCISIIEGLCSFVKLTHGPRTAQRLRSKGRKLRNPASEGIMRRDMGRRCNALSRRPRVLHLEPMTIGQEA